MKIIYTLLFLFASQNLFSQWTIQLDSISVPHENNSLFFTSEFTGYISTRDGKLYKTTNAGEEWNYEVISSEYLTSVFFLNQNTGFVTATNGQWMKTTNAGNTFQTFNNAGYAGTLLDMFFINSETGWCVGGNGSESNFISKTTNGGGSWIVQKTFSEQESSSSVLFLNKDTGFIGCGKKIWVTSNGGTNWNVQFDPNIYITHFFFINNIGYATGMYSNIFKSTDHGFNWYPLNTGETNKTLWQSHFKDENTGWIVGDSGMIITTTDGGNSFIKQSSGTAKNLTSVFFVGDQLWCVGSKDESFLSGIILNLKLNIKLDLKLLLEGFYSPVFNQMSRKDTVTAYLRNAEAPFSIVDSASNIIDSITFSGRFSFENAEIGNYYIVAKHFNSIETWSKSGGESINSNYNYDFTNSQSKAFGNNMVSSNSKWCIYSGDVDQNGAVNLDDLINIYNDANNFTPGYRATDLNGDYIVNLSDLLIAYNNVTKFVGVVRP